tara:strand:- start:2783 stop:3418 length:636 start_codon:yes stop_codon:yes gene_type:complete
MRTLVIDTATLVLSLALFDDAACVAEASTRLGRGHAERLLPAIAALPNGGLADTIAVDVGPGSFTGVRIGVAAARALAFAWGVPLNGYSSLSLIAATVKQQFSPEGAFPVVITGGHGELFWQMFAPDTACATTPLRSTAISALAVTLTNAVVYGSGATALVDARGFGDAIDVEIDTAQYAFMNSIDRTLPATPLYGRGADAMPMAGMAASA